MDKALSLKARTLFLVAILVGGMLAKDTKFLLVLARHGARYPIEALVDPKQKGELTENGLRMSYLLGKYVRKQYSDFFPQKFNYNQNYILASGTPRTQMSAQAFMLGIYDFHSLNDPLLVDKKYYTPEWEGFDIDDDFKTPLPQGFQPVPVHSYNQDENYAFESFNFDLCPKVKAFTLQDSDTQGKELLVYLNETLDEIKAEGFDYESILGTKKLDHVLYFYILADYIIASRYAGKDVGLSEKLYNNVYILYSMVMNYVFFRESKHGMYVITELGRLMSDQFELARKAIAKKDDHYNHFVHMNGHDISILGVLNLAGRTSYECVKNIYLGKTNPGPCELHPPYASSLFFDVYESEGDLYVDTIYNGQKIGFCSIDDPDEKCPYEQFIARFKGLLLPDDIPTLRKTYCYQEEMSKNKMMIAILAFNIGVIAVVSVLIVKYRNKSG